MNAAQPFNYQPHLQQLSVNRQKIEKIQTLELDMVQHASAIYSILEDVHMHIVELQQTLQQQGVELIKGVGSDDYMLGGTVRRLLMSYEWMESCIQADTQESFHYCMGVCNSVNETFQAFKNYLIGIKEQQQLFEAN